MGSIQKEGTESTHVIDSTKIACPYCDGVEIMLSNLMDDPIDITTDTRFQALMMEAAGSPIHGLVGLCVQCGYEWVPLWYLFDVATSGAGVMVMTNLDSDRDDGSGDNAVADLLAGIYVIYLGTDVNDTLQYFTVATNDAAEGVTLTMTVAPHNDTDGICMVTNVLPFGSTPAA